MSVISPIFQDKNVNTSILKLKVNMPHFTSLHKAVYLPHHLLGIIIASGGSMFVEFVDYPYPRIQVPMNV